MRNDAGRSSSARSYRRAISRIVGARSIVYRETIIAAGTVASSARRSRRESTERRAESRGSSRASVTPLLSSSFLAFYGVLHALLR